MTSTASIRKPFFLEGNFAPVEDEITATDLEIRGELPRELSGVYLRNGPNPKNGTSPDWFIGDGMVHGVFPENGHARWYRNRYVRTARLDGRQGAGIRGGGPSNTHVMAHAGRTLTFVETSLPMELDQELGTIGPHDFAGGIDTAFTAHAKVCPLTGELLAFGYQFDSPHLTLYRTDRTGRITERRVLPIPAPSYLHDFAITERYALFFDTPARMVADWGGGVMPFRWEEGAPTRIGVVPRTGGETRWFPIAACHLSHTANAFEIDGRIVVDSCTRCERYPAFPRLQSLGDRPRSRGRDRQSARRPRPRLSAYRRATHRPPPSLRLRRGPPRLHGTRASSRHGRTPLRHGVGNVSGDGLR